VPHNVSVLIIQDPRLEINATQVQETQSTISCCLTNFRHNPWDLTEEQLEKLTNISNSTKTLLNPPNLISNTTHPKKAVRRTILKFSLTVWEISKSNEKQSG
jgi:hypothetical protein